MPLPKVFVSYSRTDAKFVIDIQRVLEALRLAQVIEGFFIDINDIAPGTLWANEILEKLSEAEIVLLLISDDFLASEWCMDEKRHAIKRMDDGSACVIPVNLSSAFIADKELSDLQILHNDKPIASWGDDTRDAWSEVGKAIANAAKGIVTSNEEPTMKSAEEAVSTWLRPFREYTADISRALEHELAEEVWLMASTGEGWFKRWDELRGVVDSGRGSRHRCLFLDPRNRKYPDKALKDVFDRTTFDYYRNYKKYRSDMKEFMENCAATHKSVTIRVIDHLPSWTLLIINPNRERHQMAFVELRPFAMDSRSRPSFKLTPEDGVWFDWFVKEFDTMWNAAHSWP